MTHKKMYSKPAIKIVQIETTSILGTSNYQQEVKTSTPDWGTKEEQKDQSFIFE